MYTTIPGLFLYINHSNLFFTQSKGVGGNVSQGDFLFPVQKKGGNKNPTWVGLFCFWLVVKVVFTH